jgi:hypothetical protein
MNIQLLPVSGLQPEDSVFDIFHRRPTDDFVDSVRQHGVLQPVYVIEQPDGYELVAGFKRRRAACEACCSEIPVIILPAGTPVTELLDIRLELDCSGIPIPVMAQAGLVRLANTLLDEPFDWLCRPALRRFLPMNRDIYDRLVSLDDSGVNMKEYYWKYNAPLAIVSTMLRQDRDFQEYLAGWALRYRIRPVELDKLLNETVDCAKLHGRSVADAWEAIAAGQPKNTEGRDRVEYLSQVKQRLAEMRYPYLSSLRRKCAGAAGKLKKTYGTAVTFDPSFESDTVTISFSAENIDEFDSTVSRLQEDTARETIMEVFTHE